MLHVLLLLDVAQFGQRIKPDGRASSSATA